MKTEATMENGGTKARGGLRWPGVVLIVIVTIAATAGVSYWLLSHYLFLKAFKPVELKPKEEQVLNGKLRAIGIDLKGNKLQAAPLKPEPYSEVGARREIEFSERELNAMLAKNTDLAHKVAIDLSDDLISAKMLFPLEEDFPILGGKTLRVNAGVIFAFREGRPVVKLKGISVMGVPLPNAWLGNLKNVDLVREFGGNQGFWKRFADGVEHIQVEDGRLMVKLKK